MTMQNFISKATVEQIDLIIEEIEENMWELFTDEYGNYFC
jgi:hypothetical protein